MRKSILALLAIFSVQPALCADVIGISNSGGVYRINDATGADSFVQDLGLANDTYSLAYRDNSATFFTVSGGNLYEFVLGSAPVFRRTLPFLTGNVHSLAVDSAGILWAIDRSTDQLYHFGAASGQTAVGVVPAASFGDLMFAGDGSLYAVRGTADQTQAGLYVLSQRDGHATRVSTGNFDSSQAAGLANNSTFSGIGLPVASHNLLQNINLVTGALTPLGGSLGAIKSLDYATVKPNTVFLNFNSVNFGTVVSNTLGCLDDRDNDPLRVCKGFVPNFQVPPIQFVLRSDSVAVGATDFRLVWSRKMSAAGNFNEVVQFLDNSTSTFVTEFTPANFGLAKQTLIQSVLGKPQYVNANRQVFIRFQVRPAGFVSTFAYCYELDQATLAFR